MLDFKGIFKMKTHEQQGVIFNQMFITFQAKIVLFYPLNGRETIYAWKGNFSEIF